ncbi:hypothetical protein GCM10009716_41360 [Streptomyces sodiiphilus]|uniref:XRE family transcriptional regulator n=1 Tax=Streptomyces sodiiphilus TaxID=226217 RepID=A0ABP5B3H9_9ACTN
MSLRGAGGLSHADIGWALGVTAWTVAVWETGRTEPLKERRAT